MLQFVALWQFFIILLLFFWQFSIIRLKNLIIRLKSHTILNIAIIS